MKKSNKNKPKGNKRRKAGRTGKPPGHVVISVPEGEGEAGLVGFLKTAFEHQ